MHFPGLHGHIVLMVVLVNGWFRGNHGLRKFLASWIKVSQTEIGSPCVQVEQELDLIWRLVKPHHGFFCDGLSYIAVNDFVK